MQAIHDIFYLLSRRARYTTDATITGTATNTGAWTYSSAWKDQLATFTNENGTTAFGYDGVGNPLNWTNGRSLTWQNGRQLASIKGNYPNSNEYTYTYKYNDSGIRTQKTVDGVTTYYYLNGSTIMRQQTINGTASDDDSKNPTGQDENMAFDGDTASKWLVYGQTGAISYELINAAAANKYTVTSAEDYDERNPKDWTFEGSNDGTNWTTLDTEINQKFSGYNATNTYTFSNSTQYQYYRLNVTANCGSTGSYLQIADIGIYNGTTSLTNQTLDYKYDAGGSLVGFDYQGASYYYIYNGQGEITGILDSAGMQVVKYTYDSWGKILTVKDGSGNDISSNANNIGNINPFRYKGYYYDSETGLYYLNNRYYDPEVCRFLNTDALLGANTDMTKYNLYAYCGNNPVNASDPSGQASNEEELWQEYILRYTAERCYSEIDIYLQYISECISLFGVGGTHAPKSSASPAPSASPTPAPDIRYVSQNTKSKDFVSEYWNGIDSSSGCAVASTSMALSSLGIDLLPYQIYAKNGNSISMKWALSGACNITSAPTYGNIDNALNLYISDPNKYAPPIIGYYSSGNNTHFIVVIGGANGNYTILDPWANTAEKSGWATKTLYKLVQYHN